MARKIENKLRNSRAASLARTVYGAWCRETNLATAGKTFLKFSRLFCRTLSACLRTIGVTPTVCEFSNKSREGEPSRSPELLDANDGGVIMHCIPVSVAGCYPGYVDLAFIHSSENLLYIKASALKSDRLNELRTEWISFCAQYRQVTKNQLKEQALKIKLKYSDLQE